MTFGFLIGYRNFIRFFWVSWEDYDLHGYDCIHCVAKSCVSPRHIVLPVLSCTGLSMYLLTLNTESYDEDGGEVGEGVVEEELAGKIGTTNGT